MSTVLIPASRWHRPLTVFSAAMALLAVVALIGVLIDPRVVTGAPIWLKPFKFAVSFTVYGLTLAWMLSLLPRRSRVAEWAATVIVVMSAVEMVAIVGQVVRGTGSHFNDTTAFDAAVFQVMGTAIMVLWLAHLVFAVVLLRRRLTDRVAAAGVRLGLGLALLGMLAAVPMTLAGAAPAGDTGITGAHSVGVPDGGPGLPVTGWSTDGGDLRIGHFIGMHGLQVLPLLALALTVAARRSRRARERLDETTGVRLLGVAAGAYAMITLMLTWQAMRGQPLLRPDVVTLAALGALVTGTVVVTAAVLTVSDRTRTVHQAAVRDTATDRPAVLR